MSDETIGTNAFALKRGVSPDEVLPEYMAYSDGVVSFHVPFDTDKSMQLYAEKHAVKAFVDTSIRLYQDRAGLEPVVRQYQPRGFLHQNRGETVELDGELLGLVE
jgi:hypothetical protein